MDIYKLKFTQLQIEIIRLLCIKADTSLNQRTIANLLSVSPTAISNAVKLLEKEGLARIEKSKTMNLNLIQLNRENSKAIDTKRVENLRVIYESGFNNYLGEFFPGSTIILFGSYSLGEDTTNSDVDIAIIGSKEKSIDLAKFSKMIERNIFLHFYTDLKSINKNLRENISNGIVLHGVIEL